MAIRLPKNTAAGVIEDGSVTPEKLSFTPATSTDLATKADTVDLKATDVRTGRPELVIWHTGYDTPIGGEGMNIDELLALEAEYNYKFPWFLTFPHISATQPIYDRAHMNTDLDPFVQTGHKPVINLHVTYTLQEINNGDADEGLDVYGEALGDYILDNGLDEVLLKFLHEGNVSDTAYLWAVTYAQNITDYGSVSAAAAAYVTAYKRISDHIRTAAGSQASKIKNVWEQGTINSQSNSSGKAGLDQNSYSIFYPSGKDSNGRDYVDVPSLNEYNRYYVDSGSNAWKTTDSLIQPSIDQVRRLAPGKPLMIGESASNDDGQIVKVNITNGGSGYTTPPTVTINAATTGSGATATATVSGGAVTSVAITNPGRGYRGTPTVSFSGGGGSGAAGTVDVRGAKFSKADWIRNDARWTRDNPDIRYKTFFWQNIRPTNPATRDWRYWAPNTPEEKQAAKEAIAILNGFGFKYEGNVAPVMGANIAPDPYVDNTANFITFGSNAGTLNRSVSEGNMPTDADGGIQTATQCVGRQTYGVGRFTHNGTASPNIGTNCVGWYMPYERNNPNQNLVLTVDLRYVASSNAAGVGMVSACVATDQATKVIETKFPPVELSKTWKRHKFVFTNGQFHDSGTWNAKRWILALDIGASTVAGELQFANIKVEYAGAGSSDSTPMLPPHAQLRGLYKLTDANFSMVSNGKGSSPVAEMYHCPTLTAPRDFVLSKPVETMILKSFFIFLASDADFTTNKLIAKVDGNAININGALTYEMTLSRGLYRFWHDDVQWFAAKAS